MQNGYKESEGKLNYELDWRFIEAMAKRMQSNKGKYEPYNWQKPMNIDSLKGSAARHNVEIQCNNFKDGNDELGHLTALACNAMMIWYQLKHFEPAIVDSEIVSKPEENVTEDIKFFNPLQWKTYIRFFFNRIFC